MPVAVQVPLGADEHVLVVDLRERRLRLDDDRAVHPVRDVREHRLGAAVVHEHARVARLEAEGERLARRHVLEGHVGGDAGGVEVDRVRDRAAVRQRHLHRLALADVDDRAGSGVVAVEGPDVVLHAGGDLDGLVLHHHVHLHELAGLERRERRVVGLVRLRDGLGVVGLRAGVAGEPVALARGVVVGGGGGRRGRRGLPVVGGARAGDGVEREDDGREGRHCRGDEECDDDLEHRISSFLLIDLVRRP